MMRPVLIGVIVTAANALASVINPSTFCSKPSTPTSTPKPGTGISPMSRATLRRFLYNDLQTLQKLYEDLILSASECEEQKTTLLEELKDLEESVNATLMQLDGNITVHVCICLVCPYVYSCHNI